MRGNVSLTGHDSAINFVDIVDLPSGISVFDVFETNKVYRLETDLAAAFTFPTDVDLSVQKCIQVYLRITGDVSISWGDSDKVAFVGDEIANMSIGNYRILAEYNPIMGKWIIGVIQDGPEGGVG